MSRPSGPADDRKFQRDVAKLIDRRRMKRKVFSWSVVVALLAAAAMYMTCGHGFGLGSMGAGEGDGPRKALTDPAPRRCVVRVTASGIAVNGKPMKRDAAVAACKAATGADVVVTGDAREGNWKDLRAALEAAGVTDIAVHEPARTQSH